MERRGDKQTCACVFLLNHCHNHSPFGAVIRLDRTSRHKRPPPNSVSQSPSLQRARVFEATCGTKRSQLYIEYLMLLSNVQPAMLYSWS